MAQADSVLITGANGFIGSRLCRRFASEGLDVIAGVRKSADLSLLKDVNVSYRYGNITQPESLPAMVKDVDYVIHNAGLVKAKRIETFFEVNERGTDNLLTAVAEHNPDVKKVVFVSSMAVAGPARDGLPVTESDPPNPITMYGRSKLAGEQVARAFSNQLPIVVIRPPGVYGPGDREVFTFFLTVYRRFKPNIGNVQRKIQLVHVDDLCRGIFLAATKPTAPGSIYFIAENHSYPMAELVSLLGQACGRKGLPLNLPAPIFRMLAGISEFSFKLVGATPMFTREKANEILSSWEVTTEKAKREIGYESEISFAEGARQTYEWYLKEGWL